MHSFDNHFIKYSKPSSHHKLSLKIFLWIKDKYWGYKRYFLAHVLHVSLYAFILFTVQWKSRYDDKDDVNKYSITVPGDTRIVFTRITTPKEGVSASFSSSSSLKHYSQNATQ